MAGRPRLAELLCSLSLVGDAGYALEPGEAMRACAVACGVARAAGMPENEVGEAFYAALLRHVGCVGFAHELTALLGDDLQANEAGGRTNFARPSDVLSTLIPGVTSGRPPLERGRLALTLAARGRGIGRAYETTTCEVARATAQRIGLSGGVQRSLFEVFEWWNGKGNPRGLRGDSIAPGARVARVSTDAVLFHRLGGRELAVHAMKERAGTIADPALVDVFVREADQLFGQLADRDPRELVLAVEPEPHATISSHDVTAVAEAFADVADLKSVFMLGHSRDVARISVAAAEQLGFDESAISDLRIAALLHDLGRIAIPNRIWERKGALTSVEWEQVRLHPYHSERILGSCELLSGPAAVVGSHHERLDGSGYHRGDRGHAISMSTRVLGAADAFAAMTRPRPHRGPKSPSDAAAELLTAARDGTFDRDVVDAIVSVSGQRVPRSRRTDYPAGLTEREAEVVALVATGASNAEVGRALGISKRTAEHHLQHAYAKIGVSSRAAAALFAVDHDIVAPEP